jgi:hypothetical protein
MHSIVCSVPDGSSVDNCLFSVADCHTCALHMHLQVCLSTVGVLGDVCRNIEGQVLPYCDDVSDMPGYTGPTCLQQ